MFHLLLEVGFLPVYEYTFFELYPVFRLKYISKYIQTVAKGEKTQPHSGVAPLETPKFYFKIPYVGHFSVTSQRSVRKLANQLCKPIDIRLVFTTFKIKNLFNVKDVVPEGLRTRVVYKFSCASCNACYVGETRRHFSTRVREHLLSDRSSNVFRHLQSSESCRTSCSSFIWTASRPWTLQLLNTK